MQVAQMGGMKLVHRLEEWRRAGPVDQIRPMDLSHLVQAGSSTHSAQSSQFRTELHAAPILAGSGHEPHAEPAPAGVGWIPHATWVLHQLGYVLLRVKSWNCQSRHWLFQFMGPPACGGPMNHPTTCWIWQLLMLCSPVLDWLEQAPQALDPTCMCGGYLQPAPLRVLCAVQVSEWVSQTLPVPCPACGSNPIWHVGQRERQDYHQGLDAVVSQAGSVSKEIHSRKL